MSIRLCTRRHSHLHARSKTRTTRTHTHTQLLTHSTSQVLDPSKPVAENLDALGYNHLDLPPELRPESFPALLLMGAESPLFKFDNEVRRKGGVPLWW